MNERKPEHTIQIVVAIIGATAICIAAIISLLQPIVNRLVDKYFPISTPLVSVNTIPETSLLIPTVINTPIPGNTQIIPTSTDALSVSIATPLPEVSATPDEAAKELCLPMPTQYIFLGSDWSSAPIFPTPNGPTGKPQVFTHCPPRMTIQYESIAVDDEIEKVELVCADGVTDITDLFIPFTVTNEQLIHWRSSQIALRQNCRIDFSIKDTKGGGNIGMQIKQSVP